MRQRARPLLALLCAATLPVSACATTHYAPQLVARGELVLHYDSGFEMWGGGRRVARSLLYQGLEQYVRCVPQARDHARTATRHGATALGLSIVGGTLGVAGMAGLYGLADPPNMWYWLGGGLASAVTGTVLAALGRKYRNSANGHAVDALNYYNDAVGSLGASCDDLRYPDPAGPAPPDALPAQPSPPVPQSTRDAPPSGTPPSAVHLERPRQAGNPSGCSRPGAAPAGAPSWNGWKSGSSSELHEAAAGCVRGMPSAPL